MRLSTCVPSADHIGPEVLAYVYIGDGAGEGGLGSSALCAEEAVHGGRSIKGVWFEWVRLLTSRDDVEGESVYVKNGID